MSEKQIDNIGRIETYKMVLISATLIILLPTLIAIIQVSVTCGFNCLSFHALTESLKDKWSYVHVFTSGIVLSLIIYFLGQWAARQIIRKNKNKFFIGVTTFLCLWIVYFFCTVIIGGVETKATRHSEQSLFSIIINGWIYLTIIIFGAIAIPTSIIFGFFLGRQIKKRGDKLANL